MARRHGGMVGWRRKVGVFGGFPCGIPPNRDGGRDRGLRFMERGRRERKPNVKKEVDTVVAKRTWHGGGAENASQPLGKLGERAPAHSTAASLRTRSQKRVAHGACRRHQALPTHPTAASLCTRSQKRFVHGCTLQGSCPPPPPSAPRQRIFGSRQRHRADERSEPYSPGQNVF
jgi:hypothetical protein